MLLLNLINQLSYFQLVASIRLAPHNAIGVYVWRAMEMELE